MTSAVQNADEYDHYLGRALAESEADPILHATVLAGGASDLVVSHVGRLGDAEAWVHKALALTRLSPPARVTQAVGWVRILRGARLDDLIERFAEVPDEGEVFHSLDRLVGIRLAFRGEVSGARATFTRLLALADERGEEWSYGALLLQLTELELRTGNLEATDRLLAEWSDLASDGLTPGIVGTLPRCHALLAAYRGRPEEAERWAAVVIRGPSARWDVLEASRARGIAALLGGEPERAAVSLRTVWEHTQREGINEPGAFPAAPDLVEALAECGELEEARAVTTRLRQLATEQQHPWGLATGARCLAIVQLASHADAGTALSALTEAAAAYDELGLRYDHARSLLIRGRAERRLRKWGAARHSLEDASVAFDQIESPGWADQARSELARVGARRPRGVGELTPAEQSAAQLAADGRSNKEIAGALSVSVHTVEVHLSHAYAKLGVQSRTQLARRLAATGSPGLQGEIP
jgi:DNA-binding CsgD family transcriptional regulator